MKALLFTVWLLCSSFTNLNPASVLGVWQDAKLESRVEITRQGDVYTGRYVGFRNLAEAREQGQELNKVLFQNMKPKGDLLEGEIVDPESGKTYKATLQLTEPTRLLLKVTVMGMTAHAEVFTRVPAGAISAATKP